jgi:hypothetical protein
MAQGQPIAMQTFGVPMSECRTALVSFPFDVPAADFDLFMETLRMWRPHIVRRDEEPEAAAVSIESELEN